ncbi:hypothetical protein HF519_24795 [Pseudonocardia bannensis]|uniref:J domain-containing protein n=2 Tax=Pseudonocardia bannensis TaxID=630973 RepID=A0A848DQD1_9PSEU|nr:hypothetical protein [Pseudonocardia bannensis]
MTAEERAAYRAFIRDNHPDRGGDPDAFVAGLARFRAGTAAPEGDPATPGAEPDPEDARYDAPVVVVADLPFAVRVAIAAIRTVRRQRNNRVD